MPFAGPRLAGAVEKPLSKPLAGRAAAAASRGPHAAGRAPATAASVAELDMRVARDLTVPANRHADRVEKAGEAFVNVVSTKLRDFRTFDGSQRLKNSRLYAQRIVRAALYLDDYQKLGGAPGLAITSLVRETRSAMASTFQSLLASDDFKIAELDFEELKALQSALEMFGVPMEGLDDKFNAAHHALAASRVRFLDVEGLSNDASPAKPIPTRQQFIDSVRAPQRDITFLGFTIRARDTAYKGLLAQLDTYHGAATGKHASVEDAQAVRTAFVAAKQSVESYVADLSNAQSDRDAVRVHILPLQRELAVLDRAITTIRRSPQHLPADLQTLCTRERAVASEIFSMVRGPDSAFTELNAQGAVRHGLPPELARSCATRSPERAEKMTPLGKGAINTVYLAKLSVPGRLRGFAGVYKKNSESVDEASLAAGISKDRPTSALRNLATWRLNQRLELGVIPETHLVLNGAELGCSLERARGASPLHAGNRQIPVSPEVAQRLRNDPDLLKNYALQKGFPEATLEYTEEGAKVRLTLQSRMPDGSVLELDSLNPTDFSDPILRRQLTRLQWLDALTGQCDRHAHNYFVERDAQGGVHVRGIDNDMAFGAGPKLLDPDKLPGKHSPSLPKVIDRATADLLRGLKPDELAALCAGLSGEEIDAAKQRLNVIQQRIASFEQHDPSAPAGGRVLNDDAAWSAPETSELLGVFSFDDIKPFTQRGDRRAMERGVDAAFKSSYVARDHTTQVAAAKGFSPMREFDAAEIHRLGGL